MDYTAIIEEARRQVAADEAEYARFRARQRVLDEQLALLSAAVSIGTATLVMMAFAPCLAGTQPAKD